VELLDVVDLHVAQTAVIRTAATPASVPSAGTGGTRAGLILAAIAIVVALVIRFALANYSLWFDEYASLFFAEQPYARLWSDWMLRETNPPLFYSLLRGWIALGGGADRVVLRIPGILASVALIGAIYLGLRRIYGATPAAMAGMLLAVSAQQVAYAHQVRGYSLFALVIAISFLGLMRIVDANERDEAQPVAAWIAYVAGAVTAIYLHTTGFLWLPISAAGLILADRSFVPLFGRFWLRLAAADAVILLASGWSLRMVLLQMRTPNANISWLHQLTVLSAEGTFWFSSLLVRDPWGRQNFAAVAVVAIALTGYVLTRRRAASRLALLCWIVGMLTYYLFGYKQPIVVERTIVWFAIFPVTLMAAAFGTIRRRGGLAALGCIVTALLFANLVKNYGAFEQEDWHHAFVAMARDRKAVLIVSGEGNGVVATEACKLALRRPRCPTPILALPGVGNNVWAKGYGPPIAHDERGRPRLADDRHLYLVQRYSELPLDELQSAGFAAQTEASDDFFVGPLGGNVAPDLRRRACVEGGVLNLKCAPPPSGKGG
jgi:hypothetical protein